MPVLVKKRFYFPYLILAVVMIATLATPRSVAAGPCRSNSWQPTFVHDLRSDDWPYYVMPNGSFQQLRNVNGSFVRHACELISQFGIRDRRGFTTCNAYTRIQCGCDDRSRVNATCAAFLRFKDRSGQSGCQNYARRAVQQNQENINRGCGFRGARWSNDYNGHLRWCTGAGANAAQREDRARQDELARCGATGSNQNMCRNYAKRAVQQNRENINRGCGFSGARWSNNYDGHYRWCMGAGANAAQREDRARQDELARCGATGSNQSMCRNYAKRAVSQNQQNINRGCGFSGARWSNNYDGHYRWCMGAGANAAQREDRARQDELARCRGR